MAKKTKAKKPRSRSSDWKFLHKEWFDKSPRGFILTAAAFLDDRLQELIQAFLIENDGSAKLFAGPNASLGTFSSRIAAAYSLGLVTQGEYEAIDAMREIRNAFAHRVVVRFTDADVAGHAKKLVSSFMDATWSPRPNHIEEDLLLHSRTVSFSLVMTLVGRATFASTKRLTPVDWSELDGIDTAG